MSEPINIRLAINGDFMLSNPIRIESFRDSYDLAFSGQLKVRLAPLEISELEMPGYKRLRFVATNRWLGGCLVYELEDIN